MDKQKAKENARTYQMDRFDKASNHEISKETREKGYIVLGGSSNERANLTVKWKRRRKIGRRMRRKGNWKVHKRSLLQEGREKGLRRNYVPLSSRRSGRNV